MSIVAELTVTALREQGTGSLDGYGECLRAVCAAFPPPFGAAIYGETYRGLAINPEWLVGSLITNAAKEGEGSRKLWELAGRTSDPDIAAQIRQHALDETGHAVLYIAMLETAFPGVLSEEVRPKLLALSPGYTTADQLPDLPRLPEDHVLDDLIQMNLGEIRTRLHQLLLAPVISAHCPFERRPKLQKMLDSILADETRHIGYTGELIQRAIDAGAGDFVRQTMFKRLNQFNQITRAEIGEDVFVGS